MAIIYFICIKTDNQPNIKKNNMLENRKLSNSILELMSNANALSENEMIWENAPTQISTVIKNLQDDLNGCGIRGVTITKDDLAFVDSRLKFIKMLPVSRFFKNISYEDIKCYVSNVDRTNLVAWINPQNSIPQYLLPRNILMVNNALYQTSPYGVIKYILPNLSKFEGNPTLNGTLEVSLLNDYNMYNRNMEIIFPFEGALIRKVENQYVDLRTGEIYEIKKLKDRVALLNTKVVGETSPSALIKRAISSESNAQEMRNSAESNAQEMRSSAESNTQEMRSSAESNAQEMISSAESNMQEMKSSAESNIQEIKKLGKSKMPVIRKPAKSKMPVIKTPAKSKMPEIKRSSESNMQEETKTPNMQKETKKSNNKVAKKITAVAKKAAAEIINSNKKVKSVVKKVKNEIVPDIKSEVKKVLKKVVNKKVSKAIIDKFEGFTSDEDQENFGNEEMENIIDDNNEYELKGYSNLYETFGSIVGFTSEGGIKPEEPLTISNNVVDEILTKQNDKEYIQSKTGTKSESQLNKDIIFALDYEGIPYLFSNAEIIPYSNWAKQVNNYITQGNVGIKTIIPHYYENNGKFNTRVIIVFDDDFYTILENNNISEVMDFKKDFSISFSENISKVYTCPETDSILYQLYDSGVITRSKREEILKELKCNQ